MLQQGLPAKYHHLVWLLLLMGTIVHAMVSGIETNLIMWPGAYFLSLWALSWMIPISLDFDVDSIFPTVFKAAIGMLIFGFLHFFLAGVFTVLLERFFKVDEHYSFSEFNLYLINNKGRVVDGWGWYLLYVGFLSFYRMGSRWSRENRLYKNQLDELDKREIEKLSLQLNPHFLFNAMNSISMLVRKGEGGKAVQMISNLNDLLRELLTAPSHESWNLSEEIEFLEKYLELEKIRYGDRVTIELNADRDITARVPRNILQPLVENAFKHGISKVTGQQELKISISKIDNGLEFKVFNTGPELMEYDRSSGVGLANIQNKLRFMYPNQFSVRSENVKNGVLFTIKIPHESN